MDHRQVANGLSGLPPVPEALPTPGVRSANETWNAGRVEFEVPDTSHLPSGGVGGTIVVSAHVLPSTSAHGEGSVATVITYPDGYRLGSLWASSGVTATETWRNWMNGADGMGHAFTRLASPWSVIQRAWAVRQWYDFAAAAPDGASLPADDWQILTRAATRGLMGEHSGRLASKMSAPQVNALQQAGFWLPDPAQTTWLGSGSLPLATSLDDDPTTAPDATRLYDLYASGWTVEAYQNWSPSQPVGQVDRMREFLAATRQWDATIEAAYAHLRAHASGEDASAAGEAGRTGEIASLCLRLGYTPFHVGVMVGEGSFNAEALRTMVALRGNDLAMTP